MLYIHQFPDWTHFRFDLPRVLDALGKTRLAEGMLIGMIQVSQPQGLEPVLIAEDTIASFAIDDIPLPLKSLETELQDQSQMTHGFGPASVIQSALKNSTSPLSESRLFHWHAAISRNRVKRYRNSWNNGPSPDRVPSEMNHFLNWFESSAMDGVIKAAIAQFWFLTVRPFDSGNGRLARAITTMLLARAAKAQQMHYALNATILLHRDEYFGILSRAQGGNGDLTEWVLWFLAMMQEAIDETTRKLQAHITRLIYESRHTDHPVNCREQQLLDALFGGDIPSEFTTKDVATQLGTSHDTALRTIQSLLEKKRLHASTKGGRSQTYHLEE